ARWLRELREQEIAALDFHAVNARDHPERVQAAALGEAEDVAVDRALDVTAEHHALSEIAVLVGTRAVDRAQCAPDRYDNDLSSLGLNDRQTLCLERLGQGNANHCRVRGTHPARSRCR